MVLNTEWEVRRFGVICFWYYRYMCLQSLRWVTSLLIFRYPPRLSQVDGESKDKSSWFGHGVAWLWPVKRFPISQNVIQGEHPWICELSQSGEVTVQRSHRVCSADENHPWHWGTAQNLRQAWRRVSHNRRWSGSRRRTIVSDNNFPSYVQVLHVIILSYNKQNWRYDQLLCYLFFIKQRRN